MFKHKNMLLLRNRLTGQEQRGINAQRGQGNEVVEAEGFENYLTTVGHGVGRDIHELPFLKRGDPTVLEPGMTLAVEFVTMHKDLGCVAVEDNIVITAHGYEPFSTTGRELYVIG